MDTESSIQNEDHRTPEQVRYDAICDQVVEATKLVKLLSERLEKMPPGQTQTVIHRTEGMGSIGILCTCISAMCLLFLILGAILIVPDIHDLRAWNDINRKDIARLQAQQPQQPQQPK